jgi:hypothetical protein
LLAIIGHGNGIAGRKPLTDDLDEVRPFCRQGR